MNCLTINEQSKNEIKETINCIYKSIKKRKENFGNKLIQRQRTSTLKTT